jgi:uncharacterized protein YegJ (DUF2314 family)
MDGALKTARTAIARLRRPFTSRIWSYGAFVSPGDLAKLIFKIAVEGDEHGAAERMWVIVRERTPTGYVGMLNNELDSIAGNNQFWLGTELPFEYRHIIAVAHGDEASVALAKAPVPFPWDRSR